MAIHNTHDEHAAHEQRRDDMTEAAIALAKAYAAFAPGTIHVPGHASAELALAAALKRARIAIGDPHFADRLERAARMSLAV